MNAILRFQNLSLRRKQMLIITSASSIVLFLACAAFITFDTVTFRRELRERVTILGDAVGNNSAAAIDFKDVKSAEQTLAALRVDDNIVSACLYSMDGRVFAIYQRDRGSRFVAPPMRHSGQRFTSDELQVFLPIKQEDQFVGTIFVASDLKDLTSRLMRYLGIGGLVLLASLLVGLPLSSGLQRVVSNPILKLAELAREVAQHKNYSIRAQKSSNDELGELVDGFNEMLVQIQSRDAALNVARDELEQRVLERTAELEKEISERRRSEEERMKFFALVENSSDYISMADRQGKVFYLNPAGRRMAGIAPDADITSINWRELYDDKNWHIRCEVAIPALLAMGHWDGDLRMRNLQTGRMFDLRVTAFQVEDPQTGESLCLATVQRDITASKLAEEEREKFVALLENSTDFIGMATLEGRPFYLNKAGRELVGLHPEINVASTNLADHFDPETAELLLNTAIPESLTVGHWAGEGNLRHFKTQALIPVHIHSFLVRHPETHEPICLATVQRNITEIKQAERKLEKAHRELMELSRLSGMAEIATNVLHNVGNVLNSVNISTGLIVDNVKKSRVSSLARVVGLLQAHADDLGQFITNDPGGKHVPAHLAKLSEHLLAEQATNVGELDSLRRNIDHIKEIVSMQQSYAKVSGVKEMVNVADLVEDSLRINEDALLRQHIEVVREFEKVTPLNLEKHAILQILVNLLRNAKHACQESERADKRLTVRVANGNGSVKISVMDNGVGIPPENLTRIFNHGFTTRKDGHGFGLHSGALAAKEMGGSLTAHSGGAGQGATFTLDLPCANQ